MSDPHSSANRSDWEPPSVEELQAALPEFEILAQLGEGGMGAVFKARQPLLDRMVAIKILPQVLTQEQHAQLRLDERFKQEARALARLTHPAITAVHDFGRAENGLHYIVMEYIDGMDLHQYAQYKGGTLPLEEVVYVAQQVLAALDYAHGEGILHRDIKPANILVRRSDGQVKLVDFGLAKILGNESGERDGYSALTLSNVAVGTPDFVAPEAALPDNEPDARGDLYAFGITLYLLLTGLIPRGKIKPVSAMCPQVDPRIDPVIDRALEMYPEDRYPSAVDFLGAINRLTGQELTSSQFLDVTTLAVREEESPGFEPATETPRQIVLAGGKPEASAPSEAEPETRSRQATTATRGARSAKAAHTPSRSSSPSWVWPLVGLAVLVIVLGIVRPWTQGDGEAADKSLDAAAANAANLDLDSDEVAAAASLTRTERYAPNRRAAVGRPSRVRVAGYFDEPLEAERIEAAFGDAVFTEVMAGHFGQLAARSADGSGRVVDIHGKTQLITDELTVLARDFGTVVADRQVINWEGRTPLPSLPASETLFSGDHYFFIYLDTEGHVHFDGIIFHELNTPSPPDALLRQLEQDRPHLLSLSRVPATLTYVTPDNRVRSFYHSDRNAGDELAIPKQPDERIVDLLWADGEVGAWIARSADGQVYAEGLGGFARPLESLSPARKIRSSGHTVAAQRHDGTWVALGPDEELNRLIAAAGSTPDLDFEHHPEEPTARVVIWLDPVPEAGRSGRVRIAGHLEGEPLPYDAIETAFGNGRFATLTASYREVVAGREDGSGLAVALDGRPRLTMERLELLDRPFTAYLADDRIAGRSKQVTLSPKPASSQLFSGDEDGYVYIDKEGKVRYGGRSLIGSADQAFPEALLAQIEADQPTTLALSRNPNTLTYVTHANGVKRFVLGGPEGGREIPITPQPSEPIVEILVADNAFGTWIARSAEGNVYAEGRGGFTQPVPELSPALQIRSSGSTVAVQRLDRTWFAVGPDKGLNAQVASVGAAIDLDIAVSGGHPKASIVAWIDPSE